MIQKDINLSEIVEGMLDDWARWSVTGLNNGLGYSRLSNIGLIIENGGLIIHSNWPKYLPDHPTAEEMDKWIVELSKEKPTEADALVRYYLTTFCKEIIARKLGISVRMLEIRIKTAKTWLEGRCASKKF